MEFISTRSAKLRTNAAGAILHGLASDGGLFLPDEIPQAIMLAGRIEPEIYKIAFSDDGDSWLEPIEDEDEYRDVEQIFYRREEAREWDEETQSEE